MYVYKIIIDILIIIKKILIIILLIIKLKYKIFNKNYLNVMILI